jgi:hypothetical protein
MATGTEFVTDALGKLGIRAAETPIEAADMLLGINTYNDIMSAWDESGTKLGFVPLADESDTVRLRRGAHWAVKANLAGVLSVPFQKPISPELAAEIKAANQTLLRMTVRLGDVAQPATLPRGTGNDRDQYNDRFFPEKNKSNW